MTNGAQGPTARSELGIRNSKLEIEFACVGGPENQFRSLALELFALQFDHNPAFRKLCEARQVLPETLAHWSNIPAIPAAAFKELELTSLSPGQRTRVFHSSGTTAQRPSRHFHSAESLEVYEASLWAGFAAQAAPDFRFQISDFRLVVLTPPPAQAPQSSLVYMFDCVRQKLGADEQVFCGRLADGAWTLDSEQTVARLESFQASARPLLLLGTAFSFVHLLDGLAERDLRFQLPAGSLVLETGGYKGRSRTLTKAELHEGIADRFGVSPSQIVCEYGMSELSSQAYDSPLECRSPTRCDSVDAQELAGSETGTPAASRAFHFPPWARAQIISPETGREVADGETGLIRVFDLANVFSVMAIQTEDLAVRRGDGFELLGRAARAEPRGCSLTAA